MIRKLRLALSVLGMVLVGFAAAPASAVVSASAYDGGGCVFTSVDPRHSLADTHWRGTVEFTSGPNTGIVENTDFYYYADQTLYETAAGPAGDYTGTGQWGQDHEHFCLAFHEPIQGAPNLEVRITEHGCIAANGKSYVGYAHGQLYQYDGAQWSPVPGASGDTITRATKQ